MITAIVIPAYKPEEKLIELVRRFDNVSDIKTVVVDDGSGSEFESIFSQLDDSVTLLRHEVNKGKGRALKTAIAYIKDNMTECDAIITADADGQHKFEDIIRLRDTFLQNQLSLVTGGRMFDGDVPLRSRFGNTLTRHVFAAASGVKVRDTQTGLRAFGRTHFESFLNIEGERYEYEINMLLYAAQEGVEIVEIPIATIYYDDNSHSHFNKFRDSFKIYLCFIKFASSSFIAFLIDFILLLVLKALLTVPLGNELSLLVSTIGARIISASCNFAINRKAVFHSKEKLLPSILKYAALSITILAANYLLLRLLNITLSVPLALAKIIVEVSLFVVNFFLQGKLVFRKKKK
ncbi:MAG: bifunctional glycosyltransferase family 2/GtrA family protein [Clostridia bacterium]|nr:bifunctional glycosyltransferase family 2/GtrA family protein [Clostridia bacterium]